MWRHRDLGGLVLTIVTSCWFGCSLATAATGPAQTASEKNAESLGRIRSYHIRIVSSSSLVVKRQVVAPLAKDSEIEIWKQALRRRQSTRMYRIFTPSGVETQKGNGSVVQTSVDERELRQLHGWDPNDPYTLPLEFGRNATEFDSVKGTILPSDPKSVTTALEATSLLWSVAPGFSMNDAAKVGEIAVIDQPNRQITRLQIRSTADPKLSPYTGTVIDVDHMHGDMISRIERSDDRLRDVYEVLLFQEAEPGLWIPAKVQLTTTGTSEDVTRFSAWDVDICEVNVPLSAEVLMVSFPEGAQVIEGPDTKIHVWGKDGPAQTFTSDEAFRQSTYAHAREFQSAATAADNGHPGLGAGRSQSGALLVALNVAGVLVICSLIYLRRRLSRARGGQSVKKPSPGGSQ